MNEAVEPPSQRVDRWLWMARFFKSRTRAADLVAGGHLRVNSVRIAKARHPVRAEDVLTFVAGERVRVIRVLGIPARRGPAPEARTFYEDLSPPPPPRRPAVARRDPGSGRPTKADRRDMDHLRGRE